MWKYISVSGLTTPVPGLMTTIKSTTPFQHGHNAILSIYPLSSGRRLAGTLGSECSGIRIASSSRTQLRYSSPDDFGSEYC